MTRWLLIVGACIGLTACNPLSALWIRVEAPLQVPDQSDSLTLKVYRTVDQVPLYDHLLTLTAKTPFPVTLSLTTENPQDLNSAGVDVLATARLGSALAAPWASGVGHAVLTAGQTAEAVVKLCDCPDGG